MQIIIGSDHAGFEMKEMLKSFLEKSGHTIIDKGTNSLESTDYPDYAHAVAAAVVPAQPVVGLLHAGDVAPLWPGKTFCRVPAD